MKFLRLQSKDCTLKNCREKISNPSPSFSKRCWLNLALFKLKSTLSMQADVPWSHRSSAPSAFRYSFPHHLCGPKSALRAVTSTHQPRILMNSLEVHAVSINSKDSSFQPHHLGASTGSQAVLALLCASPWRCHSTVCSSHIFRLKCFGHRGFCPRRT